MGKGGHPRMARYGVGEWSYGHFEAVLGRPISGCRSGPFRVSGFTSLVIVSVCNGDERLIGKGPQEESVVSSWQTL